VVAVMQRGEIWIANLNPNKGSEIGKARPVVILQANELLESELATVVVVPLTTQYRPAFAPLRIKIEARDRLLKACYAMAEHPRALDRQRLTEGPLTTLSQDELTTIERSLKAVMGLL
jgi:mRNA interferase MazF